MAHKSGATIEIKGDIAPLLAFLQLLYLGCERGLCRSDAVLDAVNDPAGFFRIDMLHETTPGASVMVMRAYPTDRFLDNVAAAFTRDPSFVVVDAGHQ